MRYLVVGTNFHANHFVKKLKEDYPLAEIEQVSAGNYPKWSPKRWERVYKFDSTANDVSAMKIRGGMIASEGLISDLEFADWVGRNNPLYVVYFSNLHVYEDSTEPHNEAERLPELKDASDLGRWKAVAESFILKASKSVDTKIIIARVASMYGGPLEEKDSGVIASIHRFRRKGIRGFVWGSGEQERDFIHMDDVYGAVEALMRAKFRGTVNIGSGVAHRLIDLADNLWADKGFPNGPQVLIPDVSKMSRYYRPKYDLLIYLKEAESEQLA